MAEPHTTGAVAALATLFGLPAVTMALVGSGTMVALAASVMGSGAQVVDGVSLDQVALGGVGTTGLLIFWRLGSLLEKALDVAKGLIDVLRHIGHKGVRVELVHSGRVETDESAVVHPAP